MEISQSRKGLFSRKIPPNWGVRLKRVYWLLRVTASSIPGGNAQHYEWELRCLQKYMSTFLAQLSDNFEARRWGHTSINCPIFLRNDMGFRNERSLRLMFSFPKILRKCFPSLRKFGSEFWGLTLKVWLGLRFTYMDEHMNSLKSLSDWVLDTCLQQINALNIHGPFFKPLWIIDEPYLPLPHALFGFRK